MKSPSATKSLVLRLPADLRDNLSATFHSVYKVLLLAEGILVSSHLTWQPCWVSGNLSSFSSSQHSAISESWRLVKGLELQRIPLWNLVLWSKVCQRLRN